jgi:hypothetical protein
MNLINPDVYSALCGASVFEIYGFWDVLRPTIISPVLITDLHEHQLIAWNLLRQDSVIAEALSKSNLSAGITWVICPFFREVHGLADDNSGNGFAFRWLAESKLFEGQDNTSRKAVFGLVKRLRLSCNIDYQYVCWVSGIPYPSNEKIYYDLIFIADTRSPSDVSLAQFLEVQNI